jgi:hypothetical protein
MLPPPKHFYPRHPRQAFVVLSPNLAGVNLPPPLPPPRNEGLGTVLISRRNGLKTSTNAPKFGPMCTKIRYIGTDFWYMGTEF